ncbi:MAG TPA: TetR/AcrR family transcriptional regulator [Gordonia sp. (in: high G+C Gram-positive bacteria)]|uniref:TetR/AcrR family transcriptional regulator n=1 Tax=unclassified Gordonia (in: high G+C Gram-positive bacteria) TaxID=2657482 RepID=UPI000FA9699D|nr:MULTISPECIES: TetR/AcrR family transcriptional regulator [unclassified Gordonia (in: high G+C Gram-positive bacteria)]RUP38988.1 MAG: TetR/AcrR family transcriptional regulator [Gordonia sp. (in: high G+C Gram-positive bacteria)]HNP56396.1 TetR/AcrR family transcriptional regulator [Gordonia sp. (in: high G+C Gram-positive bacteria)]HRC51262.1 TetR/AcrR family transcriptional regulator [Gordonia sp. (in: high G+C Gram-positive bacteria)]
MPRDGSLTRQRILDAAQKLVIDNGFGATSVDAVIAASGSSKGAFFHHFASKQALAEALVDQYVVGDLQLLADGYAAAESAGDDPVDRLEAFLRYFEGMADEIMAGTTGCLYTSVLAEQHLIDAGTSVPITAATEQWRERFGALLRAALDGRRDADIDALADHLWVTFEGTFLLARTTGEPEQLRRQLAVLRELVSAYVG